MNDTGGGTSSEHSPCGVRAQEPMSPEHSRTVISNRHKNLESARVLFFPLPTDATYAFCRFELPTSNRQRKSKGDEVFEDTELLIGERAMLKLTRKTQQAVVVYPKGKKENAFIPTGTTA